jgi:IrrE N-terminal-like domain
MPKIRDAQVKYRTARELRDLAKLARQKFGVYVNGQLCPVATIEGLVASKKHHYEIKIYNAEPEHNLAFVSYKTNGQPTAITLWVDFDVLQEAKLGDPTARRILSHELGHLLIHDGERLNYSDLTNGRNSAPQDEESAEWQAEVFAHFFLVSEEAIVDTRPSLHIAHSIGVERELLESVRNYDDSRDVFRFTKKIEYVGDSCGECGNFTLLRNGTCLKCDTCGSTTGCS